MHQMSVRECVDLLSQDSSAVLEALHRARDALSALISAAEPGFVAGGRLIYVGAGTSGRLGVLDASEAPPTFHTDPERVIGIIAGGDGSLRRSSEGSEDNPKGALDELDRLALTGSDILIGITAGGTTPYVLGALAHAVGLQSPPVTALISCSRVPHPPGVAHLVVLDTGPEVLAGSTRLKAGTATKMALNIISTTLMVRIGKVYDNLMVDLRATNAKLRDRAARIVSAITGLDREAAFFRLEQAGGQVKVAIVMERQGLTRSAAEILLERASGRLDLVIDP